MSDNEVPTKSSCPSPMDSTSETKTLRHCGGRNCGCGYRSYGSGDPDSSTRFGTGDCYCDCEDCTWP